MPWFSTDSHGVTSVFGNRQYKQKTNWSLVANVNENKKNGWECPDHGLNLFKLLTTVSLKT